MATVRRSAAPAKPDGPRRKLELPLVNGTPAPPPDLCMSGLLLPHGRAMSAAFLRVLLHSYLSFQQAYHEFLRFEDGLDDEHSVTVARRAERARLVPGAPAATWPERAWRRVLEDIAAERHATLVRAVVLASGQLRDSDALMDPDGRGTDWEACSVRIDGAMVGVAPYTYEGEDTGGAPDCHFAHASLVVTFKNVRLPDEGDVGTAYPPAELPGTGDDGDDRGIHGADVTAPPAS